MKILLISFSTRGALDDYLYLLTKELFKTFKVGIIVPDYFNKSLENVDIFKFKTGINKLITFLYLLNLLTVLVKASSQLFKVENAVNRYYNLFKNILKNDF